MLTLSFAWIFTSFQPAWHTGLTWYPRKTADSCKQLQEFGWRKVGPRAGDLPARVHVNGPEAPLNNLNCFINGEGCWQGL